MATIEMIERDELPRREDLRDDVKWHQNVYELTPEEEKLIDEGLAELDAGLVISGEEVERKTKKWLRNYGKAIG